MRALHAEVEIAFRHVPIVARRLPFDNILAVGELAFEVSRNRLFAVRVRESHLDEIPEGPWTATLLTVRSGFSSNHISTCDGEAFSTAPAAGSVFMSLL